jgi:hypothetical protein
LAAAKEASAAAVPTAPLDSPDLFPPTVRGVVNSAKVLDVSFFRASHFERLERFERSEAVELLEQMERGFGLCKKALFTVKKRLLSG